MTETEPAIDLHEPTLPEVRMHVAMPNAPVEGKISATALCMRGKSASFTRHVEIDIEGTTLEGTFRAGQSFGVIPNGVDAHGKPHKVRLYSIASPSWGEDGFGRIIATTPKRLLAERAAQTPKDDALDHSLFVGVCSNWLCDQRVGSSIQLSGPNGKRFVLPTDPNAHDYLFLATGTGVAPFRGFLMELLEGPPARSPACATWTRCTSRIDLVMGVAYTNDLLYDGWIRELAKKHANFHYHTAVSRESRSDGSKGEYVHHFIDRQLSVSDGCMEGLRSPRTLIYICGLAGMQVGVFQTLVKHNITGFTKVGVELAGIPSSAWTTEQIKRRVRPTHRCMLEVY
ncbi:MAG: hypothetical protein EXS10_05040 [Phycisphaerales bacterium]|nr:hypothetical protein [Phycisphaerales bacterium]